MSDDILDSNGSITPVKRFLDSKELAERDAQVAADAIANYKAELEKEQEKKTIQDLVADVGNLVHENAQQEQVIDKLQGVIDSQNEKIDALTTLLVKHEKRMGKMAAANDKLAASQEKLENQQFTLPNLAKLIGAATQ